MSQCGLTAHPQRPVLNLQVQKLLAGIASRSKDGKFLYSKFFAIGLFRLLERTGAKDPQALGDLVKAMHIRQEAVNRDLMTYKGVLSKLSAAKEVRHSFGTDEVTPRKEGMGSVASNQLCHSLSATQTHISAMHQPESFNGMLWVAEPAHCFDDAVLAQSVWG